jgi:hypothetical protein
MIDTILTAIMIGTLAVILTGMFFAFPLIDPDSEN